MFLVIHKKSDELYALKMLDFKELSESDLVINVLHEIEIGTRSFTNENIMKLRAFFFQGPFLFLVLDYCPLGDLFMFMKRHPGCHIDDKTASFVIAKVSKAIKYLHSKHIMHRDIKPENIMLQLRPWKHRIPHTPRNIMILN